VRAGLLVFPVRPVFVNDLPELLVLRFAVTAFKVSQTGRIGLRAAVEVNDKLGAVRSHRDGV